MTSDPPRLKHGADTPRELDDALDALRRGSADAARVARVAAKLGPLLDAAPSALQTQPIVSASRFGLHGFKALRLFVAGMAVGASVLWLGGWPRQQPAAPGAAARGVEQPVRDHSTDRELVTRSLPPSTS